MMKTSLTGLGVGKVVSASPAGKPDAAQPSRYDALGNLVSMKTASKKKRESASEHAGRMSYFEEQSEKVAAKGQGHGGKFPSEVAGRCCGTFDPYSDWRILWDSLALFFVLYVMFVTPYQLAFIMHEPKMSEPGKVFAPWNRHRVGLMMCDNVVDFFFLCDILLNCNTGVYLEESDEWILDRAALVGRYRASGWLYVDIASLFPYDEMSSEDKLSLLKLLKLLRLFKLLKVLRAPRILAKWQKVFSLSFKTGLILKYTVVLITILHLSACVIRMAHDLQTDDGEKKHIQTYLNTSGPDLHRGKFHKGNFAVYMDSLDWGLQTLTGSSLYITTAEVCLCLVMNLTGLLFFSFLLADLTNILCNLDPAANEFKQTVDCLNEFMFREKFPRGTRVSLREYLVHSEVLFRVKFHNELISRLSPPLQAQVCSMLLGKRIVAIPFFSYAKACELQLHCGKVVHIKPHRAPGAPRPTSEPRRAKIIMMNPGLLFNIRYLDDVEEYDIGVGRIAMDMESVDTQLKVSTIEYESNQMIMGIAQRLETSLYMARDLIIERDRTLNDRLFLVDEGSLIAYGLENPLNPLKMTRIVDGGYVGDDISILVQGHDPKPRWYTARCSVITRVHILKSDVFLDLIEHPGLKNFKKNIARYGVWIHLKYEFLNGIKSGRIHGEILPAWLVGDKPREKTRIETDNAAIHVLEKRLSDVEASCEKMLWKQQVAIDKLTLVLGALGVGGGARAGADKLSQLLNAVGANEDGGLTVHQATAAATEAANGALEGIRVSDRSPPSRRSSSDAPVMSTFTLDDFLEPIVSPNGHRPSASKKDRLQEFFCGTNGEHDAVPNT